MGANRFMKPVKADYFQTYVNQYVPQPFELMQRAVDNKQKRQDAVNANLEALQASWGKMKAHSGMDDAKLQEVQKYYMDRTQDILSRGDLTSSEQDVRMLGKAMGEDTELRTLLQGHQIEQDYFDLRKDPTKSSKYSSARNQAMDYSHIDGVNTGSYNAEGEAANEYLATQINKTPWSDQDTQKVLLEDAKLIKDRATETRLSDGTTQYQVNGEDVESAQAALSSFGWTGTAKEFEIFKEVKGGTSFFRARQVLKASVLNNPVLIEEARYTVANKLRSLNPDVPYQDIMESVEAGDYNDLMEEVVNDWVNPKAQSIAGTNVDYQALKGVGFGAAEKKLEEQRSPISMLTTDIVKNITGDAETFKNYVEGQAAKNISTSMSSVLQKVSGVTKEEFNLNDFNKDFKYDLNNPQQMLNDLEEAKGAFANVSEPLRLKYTNQIKEAQRFKKLVDERHDAGDSYGTKVAENETSTSMTKQYARVKAIGRVIGLKLNDATATSLGAYDPPTGATGANSTKDVGRIMLGLTPGKIIWTDTPGYGKQRVVSYTGPTIEDKLDELGIDEDVFDEAVSYVENEQKLIKKFAKIKKDAYNKYIEDSENTEITNVVTNDLAPVEGSDGKLQDGPTQLKNLWTSIKDTAIFDGLPLRSLNFLPVTKDEGIGNREFIAKELGLKEGEKVPDPSQFLVNLSPISNQVYLTFAFEGPQKSVRYKLSLDDIGENVEINAKQAADWHARAALQLARETGTSRTTLYDRWNNEIPGIYYNKSNDGWYVYNDDTGEMGLSDYETALSAMTGLLSGQY